MARKPDRFERMVITEWEKGTLLNWTAIAKLLRRQHRAMVRMVEAHTRYIQSFPDREIQRAWKDGNKYTCTELLNQFKEYKR